MNTITHIIKGCKTGQENFRKQLYEQYRGYALKVVFRFIYRYEKAVDVVNDGFVKAFRNFDRFEVKEEENAEKMLMGWLKRIMINTAIDELRKNKMIPEIGGISDHIWNLSEYGDNADQLMLYKDLIGLLKQLPPMYGTIFNLYAIDGYNHVEIAELLHISVGTSKSGLSRARAILQEKIRHLEEKSYAISR